MRRGFSLIELLISIAIIAVLLAILLPGLAHAKRVSSSAVCASNLRQIGLAWEGYVSDPRNKGEFPRPEGEEDRAWKVGGAQFRGAERIASLDMNRPINRYLEEHASAEAGNSGLAQLFKCPGDTGVFDRGQSQASARASVLAKGTAFLTYGSSYRANESLLDSTICGLDDLSRPLKQQDVYVAASRLLILADSAWFYATRPQGEYASRLEASWHGRMDAGNMLAADNSVRFENFKDNLDIALNPRPELDRR